MLSNYAQLDSYPRNHFTVKGIEALINNSQLYYLSLHNNEINDESAIIIASSPTIGDLALNHNKIGDAGAIAFSQNNVLTFLDIAYNKIGKIGQEALASNSHLEFLYMEGNEELKAPHQNAKEKHSKLKSLCKFSHSKFCKIRM